MRLLYAAVIINSQGEFYWSTLRMASYWLDGCYEKNRRTEKRDLLPGQKFRQRKGANQVRGQKLNLVCGKNCAGNHISESAAMQFEQKQSKTKCEQRLFEKRVQSFEGQNHKI